MTTTDKAPIATERQGPEGKLSGRVALVTGGNRGIGAAICRSLANQGASVAAGYSRNKEQAEGFLAELLEQGIEGSVHQGNIGSADDCRRVVAEVHKRYGRLDVLVNNAGITIDKPVLKMDDEDWYKVLAVNLSGAFFMSKAALPYMVEQEHGRIVNISSIIGQRGNIGQANYAASKSGLFGLTMTMAREAAKKCPDVTVNAVAPGFIETDMLEIRAREGAGRDPQADPVRAAGPARRGRPRRALPVRRRLRLYHWAGVGGQRRDGDGRRVNARRGRRRAVGRRFVGRRASEAIAWIASVLRLIRRPTPDARSPRRPKPDPRRPTYPCPRSLTRTCPRGPSSPPGRAAS